MTSHGLVVNTLDLLAAISDVAAWTARSGPARGILLHTQETNAGLYLAATASSDLDATYCASATVLADGDDWPTAWVLTNTHVRMLTAWSEAARRPQSAPPHTLRLILDTQERTINVLEDGTLWDDDLIPPQGSQHLEHTIDPEDWPADAVHVAIGGQLDPDQTPCDLAVEPAWMQRAHTVAARRGVSARMHSGSEVRCLVSVGTDWTASLPASRPIRTRARAGEFWNLTTQQVKAA